MIYCDAHFHLVQCGRPPVDEQKNEYYSCTCAHCPEEFLEQEKLIAQYQNKTDKAKVDSCKSLSPCGISQKDNSINKYKIVSSYGIHPQDPKVEYAPFLEKLLNEKRISAIGEAGFDLFTEEYRLNKKAQEEAWKIQTELAAEYKVPLVVHDRKALDEIFSSCKTLSKISAVVFHSFAFGVKEADSILNHNVNAYFSFGKQILNGNKKSIDCVKNLPIEKLLLETDAPYQTLKGEIKTYPDEIKKVYEEASRIRQCDLIYLSEKLMINFSKVFLH